jgi:hypothetical protein
MPFYIFDVERNMARWMCGFDAQREEVEGFLGRVRELGAG